MGSLVGRLEARQAAVRERVRAARERIAALERQVSADEAELSRLAITLETVHAVLADGEDRDDGGDVDGSDDAGPGRTGLPPGLRPVPAEAFGVRATPRAADLVQ